MHISGKVSWVHPQMSPASRNNALDGRSGVKGLVKGQEVCEQDDVQRRRKECSENKVRLEFDGACIGGEDRLILRSLECEIDVLT